MITRYLDEVCAQVKCREVHAEIRMELESHIADRVEALVAAGYNEEEAVAQALRQMGDPAAVGLGLHKAHRPRTDWSLIGLACALAGVGVWVAYVLTVNESWPFTFRPQVAWSLTGTAVGAGLLFFDYRRLQRHGWWLLAGGVLVVFLASLGLAYRTFASPLLFVPGLAAVFAGWNWNDRWAGWKAAALGVGPVFLFLLVTEMRHALVYLPLWAVMVLLSRPRPKALWPVAGVGMTGLAAMVWWVAGAAYRVVRLKVWLAPWSGAPWPAPYQAMQAKLAIRNAGPWGQGAFAENNFLPEVQTDFVFPYVVYTLGWVAGLGVCLLILLFLVRTAQLARHSRDRFGRFLVAGILAVFAVQALWNIGMSVGLAPVASIYLPFISFGRQQIIQLAAVGLILSVFRRKDLIQAQVSK